VLAQTDGKLNLVNANVYAGGRLLATNTNATWYYELTDWVGTKRVEANADGTVAASFLSLPYGDGLTIEGGPDASPLHYTGKVRDTETGNDYFGARYYSPSTGRWMLPDWSAVPAAVPYADLGNPQTLNLYAYVGNNPLTRTDPDGHILNTAGEPGGAGFTEASGPGYYLDFLNGTPAAGELNIGDDLQTLNEELAQLTQAPAQQQSPSTTATGDPIQNDLQKDVPGVSTVTPQPDPNLDKPHGGHQNETFALTFMTPKEQAAFLKESGRRGLFHKDSGFGPGVRLDGGLHAEHGRLDPTNPGAILVTSHIDRFNPNNGLGPMIGHFVVDVAIGSTFCSSSACLDH
jgi:RHS repeat-associated protein